MLSSQVKFSADRQPPVKQYDPDLSNGGHKNGIATMFFLNLLFMLPIMILQFKY